MTDVHFQSISDVAALIRCGSTSSTELTKHMLERIDRLNPRLNAFITVTGDQALIAAAKADKELSGGHDRGPLHGIPVAVKDIFDTEGIRTTSGSKLFADNIPERDATAVRRLKEAGAVILGKTGMYELAAGTTGLNPFYGDIQNPWKKGYDPGGSSGGSASAVAAGLTFATLGTDTGCSVREPAHCCGVTGFKPTFGLISKAGVQPLVRTMDHVGIIARSAADTAMLFDLLRGRDIDDPLSREAGEPADTTSIARDLSGCTIGVVREYFFRCEPVIEQIVWKAIEEIEAAGANLVELHIPDLDEAFAAIELCFAEAASVYRDELSAQSEMFSETVRTTMERRLDLAATDYIAAQTFRDAFRSRLDALFTEIDCLLAPTSRRVPAPLNSLPQGYASDVWRNTSIFNFTVHPSISVPCGFTPDGLPIGLMMTARRDGDRSLLALASSFQSYTNWHKEHPLS